VSRVKNVINYATELHLTWSICVPEQKVFHLLMVHGSGVATLIHAPYINQL